MTHVDSKEWDAATWQGVRRAQIREFLKLTVRERIEAVAAMGQVAARLQETIGKAGYPRHRSEAE